MITFGFDGERRRDVRCVVGLGRRLDVARLEPEALRRRFHRVVRVLVERAVVDATDVGDEADVEAFGRLDALRLRLFALLVERDRGAGSALPPLVAVGRRRGRPTRASSSSSSPPHAASASARPRRARCARPECLNLHPSPPLRAPADVLPGFGAHYRRCPANGRRSALRRSRLARCEFRGDRGARSRRCAPPARGSRARSGPRSPRRSRRGRAA